MDFVHRVQLAQGEESSKMTPESYSSGSKTDKFTEVGIIIRVRNLRSIFHIEKALIISHLNGTRKIMRVGNNARMREGVSCTLHFRIIVNDNSVFRTNRF